MGIHEIFKVLETSEDGLTSESVKEKIEEFGPNKVAEEKPRRSILQSSLNTMKFIITSVSAVPQLKEGLETIASLIGLSF